MTLFVCNIADFQTAAEVILEEVLKKKMPTTGQDRVKRCAGVSSSESTAKGSHGCERGSRIFSPSTHTHSRQHNLYSTAGQQCCVSGQTSGRLEEKRAAIMVHSLPFRRTKVSDSSANMWVLETTTTDKLGEQHNTLIRLAASEIH